MPLTLSPPPPPVQAFSGQIVKRGAAMLRAALTLILTISLIAGSPARAQSILRDAETEALLKELSDPLIRAAGLRPEDVHIIMIGDPSINAFVAGGQVVYIHSGLIEAADNANQVQGVIAHELGHIAGGHVINDSGARKATTIALLSMLLGAAAMAAGGSEAGAGVMAAGQQAALGSYLAFSRVQEATADAASVRYLSAAGISGQGSVAFFEKLLNQEIRFGYRQDDDAGYGRTHPMSGDRIRFLRDAMSTDAAWSRTTPPQLEARFQRVKAKLVGYVSDPQATLRQYPASDTSVPAHYARAYAWHKSARSDRALEEVNALVSSNANDPYFLELQGQVLLESGRPAEALAPLRRATEISRSEPLIATTFGHALIATEDSSHFAEAEDVLRAAVNRDNDNPFAWYQLGVIYSQRGDEARASLASAESMALTGRYGPALVNAERAVASLPVQSPDWIRAQDIALVARSSLDEERRRSRRGNLSPG